MRIILIKKERLINFILPTNINGNFWITDIDSNDEKRNLVNIEALNSTWILKSNYETKVYYNNKEEASIILKLYGFYLLKIGKESIILYVAPICDQTYIPLSISDNVIYTIGKNSNNNICFDFNLISENHVKLQYSNQNWYIEDLNSAFGTYVNNIRIQKQQINYGDVIFIGGMKIIVMKEYILINKIGDLIKYTLNLKELKINKTDVEEYDDEQIRVLYEKEDYFHKSPRFKPRIEPETIIIDAPPTKEKAEEMPIAYTIGPMITMGMTSVVIAFSAINNMSNNKQSIITILPTLVIAGAMLMTMIFWPILTKKYEKKQKIKHEKERQEKYSKYVLEKKQKISLMMKLQTQILRENYITLADCSDIILNRKSNLWNHSIDNQDFLSLRVGVGKFPLDVDIKWREEDFTMEEDNLKQMVEQLVSESKNLDNVPIKFSLVEKYVTGIVGNDLLLKEFLDGLLLQILTFHCYDELKIVFFTNENNAYKWEYLKILPHLFSNDKVNRFFATNMKEMKEISLYLERIFQERKFKDNGEIKTDNYKNYSPYYVIITDNYEEARDLEIIKDVLNQKINFGFSFIILDNKLANFPNACENFINIGEKTSGMFESEVVSNKQREFTADLIGNIDILQCFKVLANTPIEILGEDIKLPAVLGFLEMYNIGKVEQLNIVNRWRNSNPISSLQVPIGVDRTGDVLYLDLHEKAHGPHGLIAGMTGSGKSEVIITFILSMAVNYHPEEVSFVLIDYKGGGLAGAFQNKENNFKLPHLAGAITNLDIADMNRSLISIQSELRRRQSIFNEARDSQSESTVDIYKYQRMYREGKVKSPVSHLFIICDEFAELKSQQPDFMEQLISTARIGRSLGVHLILATQKPTGVVNDQIWSNSKFRVCLKVQEKSDSMEMLKCPDAAALKNVGRFFLQVGYNELFTIGQSAWCGIKYYPTEKLKKKIDTKIDFIDNIGNIIKSVDNNKLQIEAQGEEITNILNYIVDIANKEKISTKQLWLDKIKEVIFTEELKQKYNYKSISYLINPIIGEYDDPFNQRQGLLTLNLTDNGNTIVYGIAGSGKELFLSNMIYSIITNYSPNEVNLYLLDFGSEALKIFKDAPQVGDTLSINDSDKIEKMFKMLEEEIELRKEKFSEYTGEYSVYIKNSLDKMPLILVIINNYDNFAESYEIYIERLTTIVREGVKYGIITIVTTTGTSIVRYKFRQNFKQELVLRLNDEMEYATILGKFDKIIPTDCKGRGFVKLDDVYEYQVSYPCNEETMSDMIKELCSNLRQQYKNKAKKIPILPNIVSLTTIVNNISTLKNVPIGIAKETLEIVNYNYNSKDLSIITALDIMITSNFIEQLFNVITMIKDTALIVLDAEDVFEKLNIKAAYYNENFDQVVEKLYCTFKDKKVYQKQFVCAIIGIDNLIGGLNNIAKENFVNLLNMSKDLDQLKFIIIDSVLKLKKLEYEPWYKNNTNNSNGIFVGSGIANQYAIIINKIVREHRDDIPDNFGYCVNNGKAILVKLLEGDKSE